MTTPLVSSFNIVSSNLALGPRTIVPYVLKSTTEQLHIVRGGDEENPDPLLLKISGNLHAQTASFETTSDTYALQVSGGSYFQGNIGLSGMLTQGASDARLKANVTTLPHALESVTRLRGVSFSWREDTPQPFRGNDVGLIAQDVQSVLPTAVSLAPFDRSLTDPSCSASSASYLTIDSTGNQLVGLLVEAVKELRNEIFALKFSLHTGTTTMTENQVNENEPSIKVARFELYPAEEPTVYCVGFAETYRSRVKYADTQISLEEAAGKSDEEIVNVAWTALESQFAAWRDQLANRSPLIGSLFVPPILSP